MPRRAQRASCRDQDHTIPAEQVQTLRAQAARAPVPAEVIRYSGAGHGFNCNDRASFVPDAAADAWSHTLRWLRLHLTPAQQAGPAPR